KDGRLAELREGQLHDFKQCPASSVEAREHDFNAKCEPEPCDQRLAARHITLLTGIAQALLRRRERLFVHDSRILRSLRIGRHTSHSLRRQLQMLDDDVMHCFERCGQCQRNEQLSDDAFEGQGGDIGRKAGIRAREQREACLDEAEREQVR
ncbi:MAG: hypothetical protein QOH33_700, partial [Paraburkholderia sp.]|nr:hypothetical protein [Paraburkholderia sp.]